MKKYLFLLLLAAINSYALKPDRNYIAKPDSVNMPYKEYEIKTSDDYKLKTWVCKPKSENDIKTTLILAYGDSGNMSYWLNNVAEFVKKGFTVVMFDYRGFGQSSDFTINNDYLYYNEFVTDLVTIIKWTKKEFKVNKTGIWALSMGTIMSTLALQQEKVDFLIAEGYVISPTAIKATLKQLKNKDIILPENAEKFKSSLDALQTKTLLFAGDKDIVTTINDSKYVAALNKENKLVEFGGNHLQGFNTLSAGGYGNLYIDEILHFIK